MAVPSAMFNVPRITYEVKTPPVIFDSPVTIPPIRLVVPLLTRLSREPPLRIRLPVDSVSPAMVPLEILAVAFAPIVRLSRSMVDIKLPPTRLAFPMKIPPERFVVPETTLSPRIVPPVKFKSPEEMTMVSTLPPEILAVPPARISRELRLAVHIKIPPVTEALAPEPDVMVVIPLLTSISPPVTLRFGRSIDEFRFPLTVEIEPVTLPPARSTEPFSRYSESRIAALVRLPPRMRVVFAVPPVKSVEPPVTVKSPRVTFEVNDPLDTEVRPVTLPPVRSVFPPLIFSVFIDPPAMAVLPEVSRVPIVPL